MKFWKRLRNESYSKIFTGESEKDLKHINVKNGMLEWETGKLKPHKAKYFSLYQFPVTYDPEAKCPNWV